MGVTFALKKYEDRKSIKKKKINSSKSKWVGKTVIRQYVKSTWNISAKNVGKSKTELTENSGELFQEFQKQSPKCVLLKRCSLFLRSTSRRLLLEFLSGTASGKMVKWQKSNGEHLQMSQKQSPSGVFLKRCLSHCKKYNRIRVSIFRIFPYKDRIVILSLYGEIRVRENP